MALGRGNTAPPTTQALAPCPSLPGHDVAATALRWQGTPEPVVAHLLASWRGFRLCSVRGDIAAPIVPRAGLPAGDPPAGRVLGCILAPWHRLASGPNAEVGTWAYVDDRSLKGSDPAALARADAATSAFDSAVGLVENRSKRQRWANASVVEHLGVVTQGAPTDEEARPPGPRGGGEPYKEAFQRLTALPGGLDTRERLGVTCILSRYEWAAPFVEPPPAWLVGAFRQAMVRSSTTWWCVGRFWADRVLAHPQLGLAVRALPRAWRLPPSTVLWASLVAHARVLGLEVLRACLTLGVFVRPAANADPRVTALFRQAFAEETARQRSAEAFWGVTELAWQRPGEIHVDAANVATERGRHLLRAAARVTALHACQATRFDYNGVPNVDVEACSLEPFASWKRSLPAADRLPLRVWRGGAVRSRTRLFWRPAAANLAEAACHWCSAPRGSARHYWAECPHFASHRLAIGVRHGVPPAWWAAQPRVTAASGWITFAASPCPRRRSKLAVAACELGIIITRACAPQQPPGQPGPAGQPGPPVSPATARAPRSSRQPPVPPGHPGPAQASAQPAAAPLERPGWYLPRPAPRPSDSAIT